MFSHTLDNLLLFTCYLGVVRWPAAGDTAGSSLHRLSSLQHRIYLGGCELWPAASNAERQHTGPHCVLQVWLSSVSHARQLTSRDPTFAPPPLRGHPHSPPKTTAAYICPWRGLVTGANVQYQRRRRPDHTEPATPAINISEVHSCLHQAMTLSIGAGSTGTTKHFARDNWTLCPGTTGNSAPGQLGTLPCDNHSLSPATTTGHSAPAPLKKMEQTPFLSSSFPAHHVCVK